MPSINWNMAIRRGTALSFFTNNTVLLDEEIGVESDSRLFKLGDGVTAWNDLPYSPAIHADSVWVGLSADVGNLLEVSSTDRGFKLDPAKLNALSAFDQAYAGTIVDLLNYQAGDQHKAASVRTGILLRAVVNALGTNYAALLAGEVPVATVTTAIATLQEQITAMNGGGAHIDDAVTGLLTTWSSNHINSQIATAVAGLVDAAPSTLDTLAEFANALANNPNFATTMAAELGNCVKFVTQTLTAPQQAQARANLGIDDASGGITYTTHTSAYTAKDKDGILANTNGGSFAVLLPANPLSGYQVFIVDSGDWSVNNLTLGCNGSSIENLLEDVVFNIKGISVQVIYNGATWKVYAQTGGGYSDYVSSLNGLTGPLFIKTINGIAVAGTGDFALVKKAGDTLTGALDGPPAVSLTSAASVAIGTAASNRVDITGTATITNFDTVAAGVTRIVRFTGALILTHNAATLALPSAANVTTAVGDIFTFESLGGGNWRCIDYTLTSGKALVSPVTVLPIVYVSGNMNAVAGNHYVFTVGGVTLTLPAGAVDNLIDVTNASNTETPVVDFGITKFRQQTPGAMTLSLVAKLSLRHSGNATYGWI